MNQRTAPPRGEGSRPDDEAYAYVMGEMTPSARRAFEARLPGDPAAARAVRSWQGALAAAGEWIEAPVPRADRALAIPVPPLRPARRSWFSRRFASGSLALPGRRSAGWGLAAACTLAVVFAAAQRSRERAPVGQLDYAAGSVQVSGPDSTERHTGGGAWELRRDSVLHTPPAGKGIFRVGASVQGAMAEGTVVALAGNETASLERGAAWFWVKPAAASRGFNVRTPSGSVRLSGRSFGVRSIDGATVVEAAGDPVTATTPDGRERVIAAGAEAALMPEGLGETASRPGGTAPPDWVSQLMEEWRRNRAAGFLPSLGGGAAGGDRP